MSDRKQPAGTVSARTVWANTFHASSRLPSTVRPLEDSNTACSKRALETITVGSAGDKPFGENREQSARVGGLFALGGERKLGPGALLLEAAFGSSDLPHLITGDVSTGAISIQLGYRFLF